MIDVDQHCVQVSQISFVNGSSKLCIIIQSVMDIKKLMLLVQKSTCLLRYASNFKVINPVTPYLQDSFICQFQTFSCPYIIREWKIFVKWNKFLFHQSGKIDF